MRQINHITGRKLESTSWSWSGFCAGFGLLASFLVCDYYNALSNGCDFKYMTLGHSEFLYWFFPVYNQRIGDFTNNHTGFPLVLRGAWLGPIQRWQEEGTSLTLQNFLWLQVSVHCVLMWSEVLVSVGTVLMLGFVSKKWMIDHLRDGGWFSQVWFWTGLSEVSCGVSDNTIETVLL